MFWGYFYIYYVLCVLQKYFSVTLSSNAKQPTRSEVGEAPVLPKLVAWIHGPRRLVVTSIGEMVERNWTYPRQLDRELVCCQPTQFIIL